MQTVINCKHIHIKRRKDMENLSLFHKLQEFTDK